jgi:hypothetical protein
MTDPVTETLTPDGVSITSMDELRSYLHAEQKITVGEDDPILLLFTMHRLFLSDYETMLDRHNRAITSVISTAVKGLTEEALSENLKEQVRLADRTHQEFERQYNRARLLTVVNTGTAIISILVLFYLIIQ